MFAFALSPSWLLLTTKGDFVFCKLYFPPNLSRHRGRIGFLSLFWGLGFCVGAYLGWVDRALFSCILSGIRLGDATALFKYIFFAASFLVPVIAVAFRLRFMLHVVALIEGITYGIVMVGLVACDSSRGWLLGSLLLFPGFLFLVPKFWFWTGCFCKSFSSVIFSLLVIIICYIPVLTIWYKWFEPTVAVLLELF